jgi:hypothetical protein
MKWIMVLYYLNNTTPFTAVAGWSTDDTCRTAAFTLMERHANDQRPIVAVCFPDGNTPLVLPRPR